MVDQSWSRNGEKSSLELSRGRAKNASALRLHCTYIMHSSVRRAGEGERALLQEGVYRSSVYIGRCSAASSNAAQNAVRKNELAHEEKIQPCPKRRKMQIPCAPPCFPPPASAAPVPPQKEEDRCAHRVSPSTSPSPLHCVSEHVLSHMAPSHPTTPFLQDAAASAPRAGRSLSRSAHQQNASLTNHRSTHCCSPQTQDTPPSARGWALAPRSAAARA